MHKRVRDCVSVCVEEQWVKQTNLCRKGKKMEEIHLSFHMTGIKKSNKKGFIIKMLVKTTRIHVLIIIELTYNKTQ